MLEFTLFQIVLALPPRVEGFLGVSEGELDPIDNVITILSPGICCIHLFNMNCLHGCLQPAFNCNEAIPLSTPLNALLMMYPFASLLLGSFFSHTQYIFWFPELFLHTISSGAYLAFSDLHSVIHCLLLGTLRVSTWKLDGFY